MISRVTLLLVGDLRLVLQIPPGQVMASSLAGLLRQNPQRNRGQKRSWQCHCYWLLLMTTFKDDKDELTGMRSRACPESDHLSATAQDGG